MIQISIQLTLSNGTFSNDATSVTASVNQGLATFSGLAINTTGTYTLTASAGDDVTSVVSGKRAP